MHSSRMRTARSLAVSHGIRLGGGLPNPPLDADPLPPGCRPSSGCRPPTPWIQSLLGRPLWMQTPIGRPPPMQTPPKQTPLDADSPLWIRIHPPPGCRPPIGILLPGCRPLLRQTPPLLWTEGMTHACENITFPRLLLRAAITIVFTNISICPFGQVM